MFLYHLVPFRTGESVDNNDRAELDQLRRDRRFLSADHGANSTMSLLSDDRQECLDEFLRGWGFSHILQMEVSKARIPCGPIVVPYAPRQRLSFSPEKGER